MIYFFYPCNCSDTLQYLQLGFGNAAISNLIVLNNSEYIVTCPFCNKVLKGLK